MAYQSRARKRVHALPRAPDGSAFQKCEDCGVSVAISLVSMHQCAFNNNKKSKTQSWNQDSAFEAQPRSAFRFFVEEIMNKCEDGNKIEIENKACEIWKDMTTVERKPYVLQADKLDSAYLKLLEKEENEIEWVDEEADSAEVGKYDKNYEHEMFDMYGGYGSSDESDFLFF